MTETDTVSLTPSGMVAAFYSDKLGRMPTIGEAFSALDEEVGEFLDELGISPRGQNRPSLLKEMCDLIYTLHGYAISMGFNLDGAFRAVHAANMGKPKATSGKIPKGGGYVAPDMGPFIA